MEVIAGIDRLKLPVFGFVGPVSDSVPDAAVEPLKIMLPVVVPVAPSVNAPVNVGVCVISILILRVAPALTEILPLPPLSGTKSTV